MRARCFFPGFAFHALCLLSLVGLGGCSSTTVSTLVRGTPGDEAASRVGGNPTLGAPKATIGEPIPTTQIVTVDYKYPVQNELPQPKQVSKVTNPFETIEPIGTIDLTVGLSKILRFKDAPKRIQLAEEKSDIVAFTVIVKDEISLLGKKPGRTVLNIWLTDPKDAAKDKIYSYLVRVAQDPTVQVRVREQLEKYYRQLEAEINHAFPNSRVALSIVGTKLLVCGQAHDINEAAQILRIVTPRTQGQGAQQTKGLTTVVEHGIDKTKVIKMPEEPEDDKGDDGVNPYFRGGLQVVNMLRVPGEQQVMLKVVVAEVDRTALRNMGINFSIANGSGIVFTNRTGGILGAGIGGGGTTNNTTGGNLLARLDAGKIVLAIDALKQKNLARTLAEPTLVALNGQSAKFHAGGSFPVPVVTGFTAAGLQGVQYIPFGVQVQFTPTVTDKDRIRLHVNADISTIDPSLSANVGGTNVQGLNSREFQTVVDLRGGETMAVAGLLKNDYAAKATRLPFLGEIPVIGRLAGSSDNTSAGTQELVILVTPVLARPVDPHHTRPIPGSDVFEPSDAEFYIHGRLESHRPVDYQSPMRTDIHRMQQYHREVRPGAQAPPPGPPMNNPATFPRGYIP